MTTERIDVLAVMDSMQWGLNHSRCPLCAGWNCGPNGETDHAHTKDCTFPQARAAVAELIEAAREGIEVAGYSQHGPAILFNLERASRLRAALARVGGAS